MSSPKFSFDSEFQTKIAACIFKSTPFNRRVLDLIKPEYFESDIEGHFVRLIKSYFAKYDDVPTTVSLVNLIKSDIAAKLIRSDLASEIKEVILQLQAEDISDASYVVDEVATFARHKAMENAGLKYAELIERGDYEKAYSAIDVANKIGANEDDELYDLFGEKEIDVREEIRNDKLVGAKSKDIISTGIRALDLRLYHNGWSKKEFYVMMGPPKSGKSISLAYFAKNAALAGHNVLFVTLEVSKEVTAERIDSSITGIPMSELKHHIIDAKDKILKAKGSAGRLFIKEYPTGTLTPSQLSRAIRKLTDTGVKLDMVVVDYADIMRANVVTNEPIENSKSVYVDLRAIAQTENVVMLSAMQTNREGAKSTTARMEHVAEDFNKIRIPDLVISINRTEEERSKNQARLFFAASRNQAGEFTIFVDQNLEAMEFVKSVIKVE